MADPIITYALEVRNAEDTRWVRQLRTYPTQADVEDAAYDLVRRHHRAVRPITIATCVQWFVLAGSGHHSLRAFDHEVDAQAYHDQQSQIDSYFGKGLYGGGSGKQSVSIYRKTTITETF